MPKFFITRQGKFVEVEAPNEATARAMSDNADVTTDLRTKNLTETTTTVRREIRKRGFFGKLFKFLFIAFNVLMIVWLISYWVQVGSIVGNEQMSEAAKTGAAIGTTLGTSFILFFWMAGDVILGLLTMMTRGEKIIVEKTTQNQAGAE